MNRFAGIGLCVLIMCGQIWAQAPASAPAYKSVEYLVLGDATRGAGEPMLAVDPTNPKNIIVTAMGTLGELPPPPPGGMPGTQSIPRSTIPWLAVTHDGGTTWTIGELPIMAGSTYTRCPDAIADVTKQGVFLAGCEPRETTGEQYGTSALVVSTDKGMTWGPLVDIISSFGAARFAPGLKPSIRGASPWDRPYTFIDDSTNIIYGVAFGGSAISEADPKQTRRQAYLTASTDGGRSFGTIFSWDSREYPQSGNALGFTAANGIVAVVYVAGSAPATENVTCPCHILGLTRDQGKTFSYSVLRNVPAPPAAALAPAQPPAPAGRGAAPGNAAAPGAAGRGAAAAGGPASSGPARGTPGVTLSGQNNVLSADPTKPGRYALLLSVSGATPQYQVSVSEDYGKTWSAPVIAGVTPEAARYTKPAFEYSRDGVLGLMWRAYYADNSYDIWTSISKDGGKTFSNSLRVSHARSPGSLPVKGTGNDDISDLCMDKENIHMVWGDFRTGFMGTWYGRVAFSAFEFTSR